MIGCPGRTAAPDGRFVSRAWRTWTTDARAADTAAATSCVVRALLSAAAA
ncbi:MAG: hypothetical protein R2712_11985 [Vicinamibacterales bacterium]